MHTLGLMPTMRNPPIWHPTCQDLTELQTRSQGRYRHLPNGNYARSKSTGTDLFANQWNHQLPKYISWRLDPGAISTDSLEESTGICILPFILIGRCLQKIRVEQNTVVLIAPTWQNQPWFPILLDLCEAP